MMTKTVKVEGFIYLSNKMKWNALFIRNARFTVLIDDGECLCDLIFYSRIHSIAFWIHEIDVELIASVSVSIRYNFYIISIRSFSLGFFLTIMALRLCLRAYFQPHVNIIDCSLTAK